MTYNDRDSKGRFEKGKALGRPHGVKNKAPSLAQLRAMEQSALAKLWEAVNAREKWAVMYVLDRLLPQQRTVEFEGLDIPDLKAALTSGDISIEEGKSLSVTLKNIEELDSLNDVRERLAELERAAKE